MPGILDYFNSFGGGGGVGGPTQLVPGAGAQGLGSGQGTLPPAGGAPVAPPSYADRVGDAFNNPLVAAGLGFGGSMMSAADQGANIGASLRAGVGGGLGGYLGVQQRKSRAEKDKERDEIIKGLMQRLAILGQGGDGTSPQQFDVTTSPAFGPGGTPGGGGMLSQINNPLWTGLI
ncbi:MAG: hypothetical protein ACR2QH_15360 [Geminicoccaceae bacterium]